jgi:hypothetical protein
MDKRMVEGKLKYDMVTDIIGEKPFQHCKT